MQENISLNQLNQQVLACELKWGEQLPEEIAKEVPFDIITCSDLIYATNTDDKTNNSKILSDLFQTILSICHSKSLILFSSNEARLFGSPFYKIVPNYFELIRVADSDLYQEYQLSGISMFKLVTLS